MSPARAPERRLRWGFAEARPIAPTFPPSPFPPSFRWAAVAALATAPWAGACSEAAAVEPRPVPRAERLERDRAALSATFERVRAFPSALPGAIEATLARDDLAELLQNAWLPLDGWAANTYDLHAHLRWNTLRPDGTWPCLDREAEGRWLPVIAGYARELAEHGVPLILVPVPTRLQVYPELLTGARPGAGFPGDGAGFQRFLVALCEAGVEVVDLLPDFVAARYDESGQDDPRLFHEYDDHWTPRALRLSVARITERLRELPELRDVSEPPGGAAREGVDFVRRREERRWRSNVMRSFDAPPVDVWLERVLTRGGEPAHEKDRESPFVLLGDSFASYYREEGGDIASLLYAELGRSWDTITLPGGGLSVWDRLARRPAEALRRKRLVLWVASIKTLDAAGKAGPERLFTD